MVDFFYRAADKQGRVSRGMIQALNTKDLELKLTRMGLWLIDVRTEELPGARSHRRNIPRKYLILFCILMEQMLKAGASIPAALDEVRLAIPHARFRDVVAAIIEDIQGGKGLSEAMFPYPEIFPPVFSSLIRVGERSGELTQIFRALAENIKWEDELAARALQAVRYPLIVGVVVMALFFFLMTFLAPRLMEFIPKMGGHIPWYTVMLFSLSNFIIRWWWVLLMLPTAMFFGVSVGRRHSLELDMLIDRILLRIWIFGPLIQKFFLVRFTSNFILMYRSGVPVLQALEINASLTDNKVLRQRLRDVHDRVADGQPVSEALRETGLLSPPFPSLVATGESNGQLDGAMENVGYFMDREVRESINALQSMVEPVLTLVMGVLLGWVIMAVFAPIYETISHVQF